MCGIFRTEVQDMAQVTVTSVDGEWVVHFPISDEDFIVLPGDSTRTEPEEGIVQYGTADTYLKVDDVPMINFSYKRPGMPVSYVMAKSARGRDTTNRQREDAFDQLEAAWQEAVGAEEPEEEEEEEEFEAPPEPEDPSAEVPKGGRKKKKTLRLKKKTRRTKRNARNRKQRKSRKLSTRRR